MPILHYRDSAESPWQTLYDTVVSSGVHVGADEPTDPTISLWVDSDESIATVPIESGGTGASTAAQARANLGVPSTAEVNGLVSDVWSNTKPYNIGDYCIENNVLYKCLIANGGSASAMQPSTSPTYWAAVSVAEELKNLSVIEITGTVTFDGSGRGFLPATSANYILLNVIFERSKSTTFTGWSYGMWNKVWYVVSPELANKTEQITCLVIKT